MKLQNEKEIRAIRSDTIGHGLVGHWPLDGDCGDRSHLAHATQSTDVCFEPAERDGRPEVAALFNGRTSLVEAARHPALRFGTGAFSFSAWVRTDEHAPDVAGNLFSQYDPITRRGVHLSILTNSGVTTTSTANYRNLHFGIDAARIDPDWQDSGRPGNAVKIAALAVVDGYLFAGSNEAGAAERGRLWRYDGGQKWTDLGNTDGCNGIPSVCGYNNALYCATGRYNFRGSAMGETLNTTPGGKVYRVEPDGEWIFCGHPGHEDATPDEAVVQAYETGKADDAMCLTAYRGDLYAVSNHRRGVFKYLGGTEWVNTGLNERVLTLAIYRDSLYALINGGPVYRYEGGDGWSYAGHPDRSSQTYSAVIHEGRLYAGTWPDGAVHVYEGGETWRVLGDQRRVAFEREIMGMANYNGKVYLGTLPSANVYRMDGEAFIRAGTLDATPADLRRVWSMAVYDGKLFAGTLPSGRVWSIEAGKMATWDRSFPPGWHHIAAVRDNHRLRLYADGQRVAQSGVFHPADYNIDNEAPFRIGFGPFEHFRGLMSDVRLYGRALEEREIQELMQL